jgi:hypothetical protein
MAGLVFLLLLMPAVQLIAFVATALLIVFDPARSFADDKGAHLWAIARVTLGMIVGAVAGILAMVLIYAVLVN